MKTVSMAKGRTLVCKYPMHGTRNILRKHEGTIERSGFGPNGLYATIRSGDNKVRTLRLDRMIDPVVR